MIISKERQLMYARRLKKIITLYHQDKTFLQIGLECGISKSRVGNIVRNEIRQRNIIKRKAIFIPTIERKAFYAQRLKNIISMYEREETYAMIGLQVGLTRGRVWGIIRQEVRGMRVVDQGRKVGPKLIKRER